MPRGKPHFKVRTSLQNHRKMQGVYEDDALLAMFVRLGVMAVERFADRTGDSFLASGLDLCKLAGVSGVANAVRKLSRLVTVVDFRPPSGPHDTEGASERPTLGRDGAMWRLTIPNFAKVQGFKSGNGVQTDGKRSGNGLPPLPLPISSPRRASEKKYRNPPVALTGDCPPLPKTKPKQVELIPRPEVNGTDAAWIELRQAFGAYGVRIPETISKPRLAMLRAALGEYPDRPHVAADLVHGYNACHARHGDDFDPWAHFGPDTVLRAAHRAKYLEAYDRTIETAGPPPWWPRRVREHREAAAEERGRETVRKATELARGMKAAREAARGATK